MAPVERARASKDSEFAHAVFATFNNSGVCRSANSEAEMCRFVKPMEVDDKELAPCCKDLKCTKPVNMMDRAYSPENRARADELRNETKRLAMFFTPPPDSHETKGVVGRGGRKRAHSRTTQTRRGIRAAG